MISVDSHSKQIKLLNQYILALQKQLSTIKTELQQVRKSSKYTNDDFNRLNIELAKTKHDNEQLKKSSIHANEQLKRSLGIQKQFLALREYAQRVNSQKNELIIKIQQITADNHTIYEHMQQLQVETKKSKDIFEVKLQKNNEEILKCKNTLGQSEKNNQELSALFLREKENANSRILELENKLRSSVNGKNEESMKLNKLLEQSNAKINGLERENSGMKNILVQFNNLKAQNQRYVKQCSDLKILNDKKNDDNRVLSNVLNSRVKQFQIYSNRSNEEKTNLLRVIRSLQEQKSNLEQLNSSFKGSVGQNSRALAINMKKLEESNQKNIQHQQEINALKTQKVQLETSLLAVKKQLQKLNILHAKTSKQKQQILQRQTQTLRLKFNGQLFYNSQINKKDTQIESLQKQKRQLLSQIKNKSKTITALQQELNSIKFQYSSFKNQFISIKDGQSQEIVIIQTKLKESQRKNNLNLQRIQSLNQKMSELQLKYQSQIKNFENAVSQIQKQKQNHEKQIIDLKSQSQAKIKRKNEQMFIHTSQQSQLLRKIQQLQIKIKVNEENLLKQQFLSKQRITEIQRENQSQIEKFKNMTILNSVQTQQIQLKQQQISLLRQNITTLQRLLNQQKSTITSLTQALSKKSSQIQSLQQSNALLRNQIINSITNEQASKKQLVQIKSKAGSTYSKSRVKSTILDNSFSRNSFGQSKFKATGSKYRSGSGDKKNNFNKKRTFNQQRVSMIDQVQKRQFDTQLSDERQSQFNNILQ